MIKRLFVLSTFLLVLISFSSAASESFKVDNSTEWNEGSFINTTESNGILKLISYNLSGASFSQSFDVSGQDTNPHGIDWNPDGTKMYMVGSANANIHEYDVSTPFDISTASFSQSFDVSGQDGAPLGMEWKPDGTKMYMVGNGNDNIYEYDVSTPFDISTASFSQSFDVSGQDNIPAGINWKPDGTKMYMAGYDNGNIYEYINTGFSSGKYTSKIYNASEEKTWKNITVGGVINSQLINITVESSNDNFSTTSGSELVSNLLNGTNTYTLSSEPTGQQVRFIVDMISGVLPEINNITVQGVTANRPPDIIIESPKNKTYFDYDIEINISTNDTEGDNYECNISNNATKIGSTNQSSESFIKNVRNDIGNRNITVSCEDDQNNSVQKIIYYTIDDFEILNISSESVVAETENTTYSYNITLGDMISSIKSNLVWNKSIESSKKITNSGINNVSDNLYFEIPLVKTNSSKYNWSINFEYNITNLNGSNSKKEENSTKINQNVTWGFLFEDIYLEPTSYVEREDYNVFMNISKINDKPVFSFEDTYHRTGNKNIMSLYENITNYLTYKGSQDVGNVSSNSEEYNVSGEVEISFKGRSRIISSNNVTLTVNKIIITDCSIGSASQTETLNFSTYKEENRNESVNSDMEISFTVYKTGEIRRTYNFSSINKTSHTFCIYPSDETYTLDMSPNAYMLTYDGTGNDIYSARAYMLVNEKISNDTTNVPLYLLEESESTEIIFQLFDDSNNQFPDVITRIDRYFPSEDQYRTVSMFRSNPEGEGKAPLAIGSEVYYRYRFFQGGEFLDQTDSGAITESPISLQVFETITDSYFDYINEVGSSCSTGTTYVNCSYASKTERIENITLSVNRLEAIGSTEVCREIGTTATGDLICDGLNSSENKYKYSLIAVMNDGTNVYLETGWLGKDINSFGKFGLFAVFAIVITLGFAGLFMPEAAILFSSLGIILGYFVGMVPLTAGSIISFIFVAIILIWRMSK